MLTGGIEKLWKFIQSQPLLKGFHLIGGSALSLRIHHRFSEDLDFAFPESTLPRKRLDAFLKVAESSDFTLARNDDEGALHEFSEGGLDLHDYQQDFIVNGTAKLSFFAAEKALSTILSASTNESGPTLASLAELFKAKCLVAAVRSKTRDWLDLYMLMHEHGFTVDDLCEAFTHAGVPHQCDTALARLCSGIPQKDDEGFRHLVENAPSLEEITEFFRAGRDEWEIRTAKAKKLSQNQSDFNR